MPRAGTRQRGDGPDQERDRIAAAVSDQAEEPAPPPAGPARSCATARPARRRDPPRGPGPDRLPTRCGAPDLGQGPDSQDRRQRHQALPQDESGIDRVDRQHGQRGHRPERDPGSISPPREDVERRQARRLRTKLHALAAAIRDSSGESAPEPGEPKGRARARTHRAAWPSRRARRGLRGCADNP